MIRRGFLRFAGGAPAAVLPTFGAAQQSRPRNVRIGALISTRPGELESQQQLAALESGLRDLGWIQGENLTLDARWFGGDPALMEKYADELVESRPDLLISRSDPALRALLKRTDSIPIVFVVVADPVGNGLVRSLSRPGGNATGFSNAEASLAEKFPEILSELDPGISHITILSHPETLATVTFTPHVETAARARGLTTSSVSIRGAEDIRSAIEAAAHRQRSGLVVLPSIVTSAYWQQIIDTAFQHRVPAIYPFGFFARQGGLVSYGLDVPHLFKQAGAYANRILRGTHPGELPVQQPSKFELVINLRTAAALGLTVQRTMQLRADELVE